MINNSFIYTGTVIHKRFKPKLHEFKSKMREEVISKDKKLNN